MMMDMPANLVTRILKVADPSIRDEINYLLNYQPSTAGNLITTEYMTIAQTSTIAEALEKIQATGKHKETIYTSFVVDHKQTLLDALYIKDVLFNSGKTRVFDVTNKVYIAFKVHTNQEEAAQLMKRYNLSVLPVLNESDHLVGIITLDDVVDVIEKEASEDMLKLAKIIPIEDSYMQSSVLALAKNHYLGSCFYSC